MQFFYPDPKIKTYPLSAFNQFKHFLALSLLITFSFNAFSVDNSQPFMNIINYKLDTTNELLTSRIGLITPAHTIQVLDLSKTIDQHFPAS
jgi:hypothetical protein